MSEAPNRWLPFAREDLRMAELALAAGIFNQVCFDAQQCAEKALKGWPKHQGHVVPRTHRMADLLPLLPPDVMGELNDALGLLDRFYIPTRYPDALPSASLEGVLGQRDAEEALDSARGALRRVEQVL
jgi:HEPN domain-containing protein